MHKQNEQEYIAYAQWSDQQSLENAGKHLPESATAIREKMRASCEEVTTLHNLEIIEDLLQITT